MMIFGLQDVIEEGPKGSWSRALELIKEKTRTDVRMRRTLKLITKYIRSFIQNSIHILLTFLLSK